MFARRAVEKRNWSHFAAKGLLDVAELLFGPLMSAGNSASSREPDSMSRLREAEDQSESPGESGLKMPGWRAPSE